MAIEEPEAPLPSLDHIPWPDLAGPLTFEETKTGQELARAGAFPIWRPRTRSDCWPTGQNGKRPCGFVGCRNHMLFEVTPGGGLKMRMSYDDFLSGKLESCLLDLADRGGLTLEDIASQFDLTRERVRQIEEKALGKLKAAGADLVEWIAEDKK